jgi:hypothetical protein
MLFEDEFRRETMDLLPFIPVDSMWTLVKPLSEKRSTGNEGVPLRVRALMSVNDFLFSNIHFQRPLAKIIPQNSPAAEKMGFPDNINH